MPIGASRAQALIATLLACWSAGCVGGPEAATPAFDRVAGLERCRVAHGTLAAAWQRLDAARGAVENRADLLPTQPATSAPDAGGVETELAAARTAFDAAYADDQAALAELLNASVHTGAGGEAIATALGWYAESARRFAADLIATAGDYRRAIDLLETARDYFVDAHAPSPRELLDDLERARSYRVVTRVRFDRLSRGMTAPQARSLVGVPFSGNVRRAEVAGKRVMSWLYVNEDGGVTALYFDDSSHLYAWRWNVMQAG
jgi:hypothetical protein